MEQKKVIKDMGLVVRRQSSVKFRIVSTLIAVFALIMQPLISLNIPIALAIGSPVVVTESDHGNWSDVESQTGGAVAFVADSSTLTTGNGALKLTTNATSNAKAHYQNYFTTPVALSDISNTMSYSTKQNSAAFIAGDPSYQITMNVYGDSGYNNFTYEPYVDKGNGAVVNGIWQNWNVGAGKFYSSHSYSDTQTANNSTIVSSQGDHTYTLAEIRAAFPSATVSGIGVNVGSNNPSYDVEADNLVFNGTTYNFEPTPQDTSTEIVRGNTAAGYNQPGWLFYNASDEFEFNNDQSSVGNGSLYIKPISSVAAKKFEAEFYLFDKIANVNKISYDYKMAGNGQPSDADDFYMNVYANYGSSAGNKFFDCKYLVRLNDAQVQAAGFTTNPFDVTQSYPKTTSDTSPHTCPDVPADMDLQVPNSTIRSFIITVGDSSAQDTGLAGYLDKVVVNTKATLKTYDFEPEAPYAYDQNDSNFIGTETYVRANNSGDVDAAVRVPADATSVRFNFDGTSNYSNIAGYEHLQPNQWPNASGDHQYRVKTSLAPGQYTVTAQYEVDGTPYDVTGSAITNSIDIPTGEYITPGAGQTFRPNDQVVRLKADDEFNQFSKAVVKIGTTTTTLQKADCQDKGNYVLCDVANLGLSDGPYMANTTIYTKANNRLENLLSQVFTIDSQKPTVSNVTIDNANNGIAGGAIVVSANANDNIGVVESVNFYVTKPRASDGVCTGNGTKLADARVYLTDGTDGKYRVNLDVSGLDDGNYCVTVVSRDAAKNNSVPKHQKIKIDNTAPTIENVTTSVSTDGNTLNIAGTVSAPDFQYYYCWLTDSSGNEVGTRGPLCETAWATDIPFHGGHYAASANGTTNGNLGTIDISSLPDGDYTLNIVAYDRIGNNNVSNAFTQNVTKTTQDDTEGGSGSNGGPSPVDTTGDDNLLNSGRGTTINSIAFIPNAPNQGAGNQLGPDGIVLGASDATTNDNDDKGTTLGARDSNLNDTVAAISPSADGWKIFGIAWYWWLAILAAVAAIWWFIAGYRRRNNESA